MSPESEEQAFKRSMMKYYRAHYIYECESTSLLLKKYGFVFFEMFGIFLVFYVLHRVLKTKNADYSNARDIRRQRKVATQDH